MKTSARPFALIKIGDVSGWLKEKLTGFEFIETLEAESFFSEPQRAGFIHQHPDGIADILRRMGLESSERDQFREHRHGRGREEVHLAIGRAWRAGAVVAGRAAAFRGTVRDSSTTRLVPAIARDVRRAGDALRARTNREALRVVLEELKKEKPRARSFCDWNSIRKRKSACCSCRSIAKTVCRSSRSERRRSSRLRRRISHCCGYDEQCRTTGFYCSRTAARQRSCSTSARAWETRTLILPRHSARTYRNMEVMTGRVMDYFGLRAEELDRVSRRSDEEDIIHFRQMAVDKPHVDEIQRRDGSCAFSQTPAGAVAKNEIEQRYQQGELDFGEAARLMEDQGLTGRQTYNDETARSNISQITTTYPSLLRRGSD